MSNVLFPKLPGLHWELKSSDEFATLIQKAAAPGFETRISLGPDPIPHFVLSYDWLRQPGSQADTPGAPAEELTVFRGFFRQQKGSFDSFLLYAPDVTENTADGKVVGQALTEDSNSIAPLIVSRGGYNENIYEAAGVNGNPLVAGAAAPVIKRGGTPLVAGTDYNFVGPGFAVGSTTYPGLAVSFITAGAGALTADFWWYYRVRFEQDTQEFQKFLALLYDAQKVQLVVTRT
jgi:Conserved hypothetical protein 2217 (DUF2460)